MKVQETVREDGFRIVTGRVPSKKYTSSLMLVLVPLMTRMRSEDFSIALSIWYLREPVRENWMRLFHFASVIA